MGTHGAPIEMSLLRELIEGKWYFAVCCRNCDVQFAFLRDDEMDETIYFTDSGQIVLTCPGCYIPFAYSGELIKRILAS